MLSVASSRRAVLAGLAAIALLYVLTAWAAGAGIVDDAYIFLRYVRNIWEGAGPVFNDGERVEGYTSPLWLAVLALLWKLPLNPQAQAVGASAAAGGAALALLFLWRRGHGPDAALVSAVFLATNPSFVFWAWSGMDTALFTLLILLTVLVFERDLDEQRTPLRTGAALALAALSRLEALWLLPLLIGLLVRHRRPHLLGDAAALGVPVLIVLGPHALWRHAYYGDWLPNTFAAKVGVPKTMLVVKGSAYIARGAAAYAPLLLALLFAARRAPSLARQDWIVPGSAAAWLTLYALLVGGDHFALFRFLVPALALLAVVAGRTAGRVLPPQRPTRHVLAAAGLAVAVNAFVFATPQASAARSEVAQAAAWAKTGRWCAERLPPGSIASMVVGAIPFYCDRYTHDLLGLVDAHIARNGRIFLPAPAGHQKYDTDYILEREPAYIFFLSSGMPPVPLFRTVEDRRRWLDEKGFALEDLVTDARTLAAYEYRAERLPDGTWIEFLQRRQ
jgi:hypothetical protein